MLLIPYVLIEAGGYSPIEAGLSLLPLSILLGLASPLMGKLAVRLGPKIPLTLGPIIVGAGLLLAHPDRRGPGLLDPRLPGDPRHVDRHDAGRRAADQHRARRGRKASDRHGIGLQQRRCPAWRADRRRAAWARCWSAAATPCSGRSPPALDRHGDRRRARRASPPSSACRGNWRRQREPITGLTELNLSSSDRSSAMPESNHPARRTHRPGARRRRPQQQCRRQRPFGRPTRSTRPGPSISTRRWPCSTPCASPTKRWPPRAISTPGGRWSKQRSPAGRVEPQPISVLTLFHCGKCTATTTLREVAMDRFERLAIGFGLDHAARRCSTSSNSLRNSLHCSIPRRGWQACAAARKGSSMRDKIALAAAMVQAPLGCRHPALRRPRQDPLPDHHVQPRGAALFQPGHGLCLWLQPCRGDRLLPGGAAARSRMRHVLVGRIAGLRPQHQRAADPRRQYAGAEVHRAGAAAVGQGHAARARADHGAWPSAIRPTPMPSAPISTAPMPTRC